MSVIRSTALSDAQTRRAKVIVEFALRSGTMKGAQLEGVAAYDDGEDEIPIIARLELERREALNGT